MLSPYCASYTSLNLRSKPSHKHGQSSIPRVDRVLGSRRVEFSAEVLITSFLLDEGNLLLMSFDAGCRRRVGQER